MRPSLRQHVRAILILPVNIALVVPTAILLLTRDWARAFETPWPQRAVLLGLGVAGIIGGLLLLVTTIRLFSQAGEGTLAPWDPTRKLVVQGVYRHTRNPMITGVMAILLGEAAVFASWALLAWLVLFAVVTVSVIVLAEEPRLERQFGADYAEYRRNVPRWLPRPRPWTAGRRAPPSVKDANRAALREE